MNEDEISRLMRLKRFEQPGPEYFENFLHEFRHRQRAELLREPVWRIAWDRLCAFFGEQFPVRMGYGLASAAVLMVAAVASFNIIESRPVVVVAVGPAASAAPTASLVAAAPVHAAQTLDLNTQLQVPELPVLGSNPAHTASLTAPRYIMDAQPVSYELPSSF